MLGFYRNYICILASQCEEPPPDPYLGMDVIWPKKNKDLGSRVNYRCPFRRGTETHILKGEYCYHHIQNNKICNKSPKSVLQGSRS